MGSIFLISKSDGKPRRQVVVDEFSYTIGTGSGETIVTLPDGRTYDTDDYILVMANGLKLNNGIEYSRSSNATITAATCDMFPIGEFPPNCKLDFELFTTN